MGLEGRSFRHHGTDDKTFDVLRLHPGDRIEAHLARLPDEVAVARLAHAELRDPRPDQRDASHARLPQTLKSFQSCPRACIVLLVRSMRRPGSDRKSTRLNSSHSQISYAVFCLKKKT